MSEQDRDCPRCRGGGCEWCHNTGKRPATACDIVTVTVSGLTGSGKSAVCGEIEIALKAIGLVVRWPDGKEEKRLTHADWQSALDLYRPEILIQEVNIARIPPGYFGGDTLGRSKS